MKVSIVLLSWNGREHIFKCLDSVLQQSYKDTELILVDNNSTDGTLEEIQDIYSKSLQIVISNKENLGFALGMNIGIGAATGDIVVLLNQDVVLERDFIKNTVQIFMENSDISILGGMEKEWYNDELTENIASQGGFFLRKRIQGISNYRETDGFCFGVHGSFPCIRMETLKNIYNIYDYYYDPKYGTGWEDQDLWFRCNLIGSRAYYSEKLVAWHVGSGSVGGNQRLIDKKLDYQKRIFRNRYYLIFKNIPLSLFIKYFPFLLASELALIPYYLIKSPKSILALLAGWFDFIRHLRPILADRKKAQKSRNITNKNITEFFIGF